MFRYITVLMQFLKAGFCQKPDLQSIICESKKDDVTSSWLMQRKTNNEKIQHCIYDTAFRQNGMRKLQIDHHYV